MAPSSPPTQARYSSLYRSSRDELRASRSKTRQPTLEAKTSKEGSAWSQSFDYSDSFDESPRARRSAERHGYGYRSTSTAPPVSQSGETGSYFAASTPYDSLEYSASQGGRAGRYSYSYRDSADYSRVRESSEYQRSPARRREEYVRDSGATDAGYVPRDSVGASSYWDDLSPPQPDKFKGAWERNRDELCHLAKEFEEKGEALPAWMQKAIERKAAADKLEEEKLRTSEARWNAKLEANNRRLKREEKRLRAIAAERRALEKEQKQLEIRRRGQEIVPATTYSPEPPPPTFPFTEENREQMHQLTLMRYEAMEKERRRAKQIREWKEAQEQEDAERRAYEYNEEYYWLDKEAPAPQPLSAALATPTWQDVTVQKKRSQQARARRRGSGGQGRMVMLH